jgi:glutamate/aspartate transport system substrate-binding protein
LYRYLFLFPLLALLVAPAHAEAPKDTLANIKATKTINLGYREYARPYAFSNDARSPDGYSVDLCRKVVDSIKSSLKLDKLTVNWVPVTADNRIGLVQQGKIDLECGSTTVTLSRLEKVDFSNLIFVDGGTTMVKKSSGMARLADLNGKKVAVLAGTTTEDALRRGLPVRGIKVEIVVVPDFDAGMQQFSQGKVDALAGDRTTLIGVGRASRIADQISLLDEDFSVEPIALMMRRDPDFRLAVNRELSRLYRTGDVDEIFYKWFGQLGKPSVLTKAMFYLNGLHE